MKNNSLDIVAERKIENGRDFGSKSVPDSVKSVVNNFEHFEVLAEEIEVEEAERPMFRR
ncbi:MAG: hypothetical protein LBE36_10015 [Flavobacteriaceae bacterium]|nr:hypothetical protein [Flavobacteriaceae bacterium]